MADFRKWFYALALVALITGLTVPASAQITPFTCNAQAGVLPTVRAEGYTELVGDLILICSGGTPTAVNQQVPGVNITLTLNTNITSKLTSSAGFDDALLIIDEPNAPGPNSNRPILNCGAPGAPDSSLSAGPGVCGIISNGIPANTYDGTVNGYGTGTCGVSPAPAVGTFTCGRPNVFQGRQFSNLTNGITFNGVPVDPPGTGGTRTLRFTNIRADAEFLPLTSNFTNTYIIASVSTNGSTSVGINVSGQDVGVAQHGLLPPNSGKSDINVSRTTDVGDAFVQCNSENPGLSAKTSASIEAALSAGTGAFGGNTQFTSPVHNWAQITLQEGFANAWKTKNISYVLANGIANSTGQGFAYDGATYPSVPSGDAWQNVPGAVYNTESGFEYSTLDTLYPTPNPPLGVGTTPVTGAINTGYPLSDANGTGISTAGIVTQGTRLALSFSSVPTQSNIWVQPVLYLYRQGVAGSSLFPSGTTSGVMVLVSTDANGDGASSSPAVGVYTGANGGNNLVEVSNNLAVWEILFSDTSASEQVDIPLIVAYTSNLTMNLPNGYPTPNQIAQVTASFAPFYGGNFSPNPRLATSTAALPIPRFVTGTLAQNAFVIQRCACNLLFPFIASGGGFDTGMAIANTSADPGPTYGFDSTGQQQGQVTFFYFGTGANGAAQPAPQTSNVVPAGQVLTYVLSTGGGSIGGSPNGLNGSAAGFNGYIIAQSTFQYCHGFAYVSNGTAPLAGYLGIVLDAPGLPRTSQIGENDGH